jgi:hypothetical protein
VKSINIELGDCLPEASRFNAIEAFAVNFGMNLVRQTLESNRFLLSEGMLANNLEAEPVKFGMDSTLIALLQV